MKEIVMSQEEILLTTQKMGQEITKALEKEDKIPVCLVVMRGAMNFASDLLKCIKTNVFVDYIHVSSYEGTTTHGVIHLHFDVQSDVKDRTVLIIEDIVDTGRTMQRMIETLGTRNPASIHICALLVKPEKLEVPLNIEYAALEIPNDFIVGYGLGYDQQGRNLRDIYTIVE